MISLLIAERTGQLDLTSRGLRTWLSKRIDWVAYDIARREARRRDREPQPIGDLVDLEETTEPHRSTSRPAPTLHHDRVDIERLHALGLSRDQAQVLAATSLISDLSIKEYAERTSRSYAAIRQDYSRGLRKIEHQFGLTADEREVFLAYRRLGAVAPAAARLGITEEQLRRHLATAEAKIRNVFTPPTQTDIYEMFDRVPVGAGAGMQEAVRALPARQQQVLALTGLGTREDAYTNAGEVLDIPPEEVERVVNRGLESLAPVPTSILPQVQVAETLDLRPNEYNIDGVIEQGGFDAEFEDPATLPGQVIRGILTNAENTTINLMHPKDRARHLLQKRIEEKAEMAVLLSRLQALRHETAASVVNDRHRPRPADRSRST